MVLFLCEPVNAQDSNFPYSTMQDGYGQFLSSYCSVPSFMPGADLMISCISPAPLEYYDSSWSDIFYNHNAGGFSTTWGYPVSYQVIDNDQYMAGAYFSPTQPSCPSSTWGASLLTDGWYGEGPDLFIDLRGVTTSHDVLIGDESWLCPITSRPNPKDFMEFSLDPSRTRDFKDTRTWNHEWLYPSSPNGSVRSLYQRPLEWPRT